MQDGLGGGATGLAVAAGGAAAAAAGRSHGRRGRVRRMLSLHGQLARARMDVALNEGMKLVEGNL